MWCFALRRMDQGTLPISTGPRFSNRAGRQRALALPLRKDEAILDRHKYAVPPRTWPVFSQRSCSCQKFFGTGRHRYGERAAAGRVASTQGSSSELNLGLEARVAEQVEELGRLGRLKRFLAPPLAELIGSQDNEQIRKSSPRDRRRILRSAWLHRLHRDRRTREGPRLPARVSWCLGAARRPVRGYAQPVSGDGIRSRSSRTWGRSSSEASGGLSPHST